MAEDDDFSKKVSAKFKIKLYCSVVTLDTDTQFSEPNRAALEIFLQKEWNKTFHLQLVQLLLDTSGRVLPLSTDRGALLRVEK